MQCIGWRSIDYSVSVMFTFFWMFLFMIGFKFKFFSFIPGYWSLYLVGVQLGNFLFFGNHVTALLRTNKWARIRVWVLSLSFWCEFISISFFFKYLHIYYWLSILPCLFCCFVGALATQVVDIHSGQARWEGFPQNGTFVLFSTSLSLSLRMGEVILLASAFWKLTKNFLCSAIWPMLL